MSRLSRDASRSDVTRRGFALVATISVMVLLLMVALAMLSLSSITLRSSRHDAYRQEAKANARLALMLAIGELQKTVGPDQRVTAEGRLDAAPGHGKSHWVGAWSSVDADDDGEPDGDFLGWLVSTPSDPAEQSVEYDLIQQSDASTTDPEWIRLVGNGSADTDLDTTAEVLAQRVPVMKSGSGAGPTTAGHYAWWVGDEGVKARINQKNTQEEPQFAAQGTQRSSIEVVTGFESVDSTSDEIFKLVTGGSSSLLANAAAGARRGSFHDTTVRSLALQTDTRHGGFKKDLSLLFEMSDDYFDALDPSEYAAYVNEETPVGASATEPKGLLFYDEGIYGPTVDVLRNHYRQYKGNIGSATDPLMLAHSSLPNKHEFGANMWIRTACVQAWHHALVSDPNSSDRLQTRYFKAVDEPMTRLLRGNVTPYLNRAMMYFSVQAEKIAGSVPTKYNLLLKLQPILYIHNPYNVRMKVEKMRYLRNISQTELFISQDGAAPVGINFTALLDAGNVATPITSGDRNGEAQFIIDEPVTFAPGEMKIFVPQGNQTWGSEMKMAELGDAFEPDNMALTLDLTYVTGNGEGDLNAISQIPTGTSLQVSLRWTPFSKEDFEIYESARGGYNTVWSGFSVFRTNYSTGTLSYNGSNDAKRAPKHFVEDLKTITPIVVDDRFLRPLKFDRHSSSGEVDLTTGYPSFVLGNPLCSSDSNILNVASTKMAPGANIYSTMNHSHMDYGEVGYPYFQNAFIDNYGTWGSNNGSAGERYTTALEVPSAPLFSLGGFQHANIAVEGYMPGLAIGNSFPNMTMSDHSLLTEDYGGLKNYDLSYMTNRALWDGYFFSSITPRPEDSSYTSLTVDTSSDIENVIHAFVSGDQALGNTRMKLLISSASSARVDELKNYRTSAAHLGLAGGFNVNSTSVTAWKSFLSGYRDAALRYVGGGSDSNEDLSAFPRATLPNAGGVEDPTARDPDAWLGYAQLKDQQIDDLAKAIVDQIKKRAKLRTGPAGVTPALTMGQFVNRMLTGEKELTQRGILQAAIDESEINKTMDQYDTFDSSAYGVVREEKTFIGDGAELEVPVGISAPTSIIQSDILQALGASMTARSDTFTIRAYGDAVDRRGVIVARSWCEAVVQRVPTPVRSDANDSWKPVTPAPGGVEFGRRFNIVSFRWLAQDEI